MIEGWFDAAGRPYVAAQVYLPRLERVPRHLELLVDTGADVTSLHPMDCMGIPYEALRDLSETGGVGGAAGYYSEDAFVVFDDGEITHIYSMRVDIAVPSRDNATLPSLLGQDILRHWRVIHDRPGNSLSIDVVRADMTVSSGA